MSKTLVATVFLFLFAARSQSLEGHLSPNGEEKSPPQLTTMQGCLQTAAGHFNLAESNGTVHRLAFSNKLTHYVGHEVKVAGKPSVRTVSETSYGVASSAEELPIFEVKTVTNVAHTCKAN